ncbi:Aluminum-activated malate transporter 2 [Capsicum annuum]|uniref:Aluminum-activated malate transporter 2 n=1 Tax=Capsicum annuum TaxID=4072 RepID=A0A2G2ZDG6_CAPAN|nr:aluminum-activated malate transporter 2-like [Capsicum annuum]KAF3665294.1 Aluminum-activated malate transporter 2 [Capsicum annuum]PHT79984.1 Aluminum-activated malate transporter 2 [Capsicum annuum]
MTVVENQEVAECGCFLNAWLWFNKFVKKLMFKVVDNAKSAKKLGKEDPRRIVHSLKVGFTITLVSLFYYFEPKFHYEGFGVSAMWAVLTVVLVFEFTVGATLGRAINRGVATFLGASLAGGVHRLACFSSSKTLEPILLGIFLFSIAAIVSYLRFLPKLKARYDYGVLIFILTFSLVSVSGYHDKQVLEIAHTRLSTILIGCASALVVCIFICPVWAGEELHNKISSNLEKLGSFLEVFGTEYLNTAHGADSEQKGSDLQGYKSVLNSKSSEEVLANFAKWEPRHGKFRYRHPWAQYLEIGGTARDCAYRIHALNAYLNYETQIEQEIRTRIQEPCMKVSTECGHVLKALSLAMKTMTYPLTIMVHIDNAKLAAENLKTLLHTNSSWEDINFSDVIPLATVASLLIDIVSYTIKMVESFDQLATLARFKKTNRFAPVRIRTGSWKRKRVMPEPSTENVHHHTIAAE